MTKPKRLDDNINVIIDECDDVCISRRDTHSGVRITLRKHVMEQLVKLWNEREKEKS